MGKIEKRHWAACPRCFNPMVPCLGGIVQAYRKQAVKLAKKRKEPLPVFAPFRWKTGKWWICANAACDGLTEIVEPETR